MEAIITTADEMLAKQPDPEPDFNISHLFIKRVTECNVRSLHVHQDHGLALVTALDGMLYALQPDASSSLNNNYWRSIYDMSLLHPNNQRSPIDDHDHVELVCSDSIIIPCLRLITNPITSETSTQVGVLLCCAYVTYDDVASAVKQCWIHVNYATYSPTDRSLTHFETVCILPQSSPVTNVKFREIDVKQQRALHLIVFSAGKQFRVHELDLSGLKPVVLDNWIPLFPPLLSPEPSPQQQLPPALPFYEHLLAEVLRSAPAAQVILFVDWLTSSCDSNADWLLMSRDDGSVVLLKVDKTQEHWDFEDNKCGNRFCLRFDTPVCTAKFLATANHQCSAKQQPMQSQPTTNAKSAVLLFTVPCLGDTGGIWRPPRQQKSMGQDQDGTQEHDDMSELLIPVTRLDDQNKAEWASGSGTGFAHHPPPVDVCTAADIRQCSDDSNAFVAVTGRFDHVVSIYQCLFGETGPKTSANCKLLKTFDLDAPVMAVHILEARQGCILISLLCSRSFHVIKLDDAMSSR